jgi:hypothetical protein
MTWEGPAPRNSGLMIVVPTRRHGGGQSAAGPAVAVSDMVGRGADSGMPMSIELRSSSSRAPASDVARRPPGICEDQ